MSPAVQRQIASNEERRSHRRYPVGLEVHYKLARERMTVQEGSGKTLDFSAEGVFFRPDRAVPAGVDVELSIDWPVNIQGAPTLRVTIQGRTLRSTSEGTAVRISHCEFRADAGKLNAPPARMSTEN